MDKVQTRFNTPLPPPILTWRSQWQVSPMKGKPMEPLGMGSLQFLSRVAVQRSCHSCWDTTSSSAMDTRQAARVARADTRSKLSNSMMEQKNLEMDVLKSFLFWFFGGGLMSGRFQTLCSARALWRCSKE